MDGSPRPLAAAGAGGDAAPLTAAVLGASGNVGAALVRYLVASPRYGRVVLFGRRELAEWGGEAKVRQHVVDMARIREEAEPLLRQDGVAVCFVTMGVGKPRTLAKGEEGKRELQRVDCDVPAAFAAAAQAAGAAHFCVLTAVGADVDAQYSSRSHTGAGGGWYNHVKGLVEQRVREQGFRTAAAFRPATLLGNTNTPGFVECCLAPCLDCCIPVRYHSIHIDDLARAMAVQAAAAADAGEPAWLVAEGQSLFAIVNGS